MTKIPFWNARVCDVVLPTSGQGLRYKYYATDKKEMEFQERRGSQMRIWEPDEKSFVVAMLDIPACCEQGDGVISR
jgi:hypothetical protein